MKAYQIEDNPHTTYYAIAHQIQVAPLQWLVQAMASESLRAWALRCYDSAYDQVHVSAMITEAYGWCCRLDVFGYQDAGRKRREQSDPQWPHFT